MKTIFSILLALLVVTPTFALNKKETRAARLHKEKTKKFTYDYSSINTVPFSFHDMGMSDAEFFINDRNDTEIQTEIERIQGSLSELEYTTLVSYEPKYINQKPRSKSQKKSYLQGYLKILEEAVL